MAWLWLAVLFSLLLFLLQHQHPSLSQNPTLQKFWSRWQSRFDAQLQRLRLRLALRLLSPEYRTALLHSIALAAMRRTTTLLKAHSDIAATRGMDIEAATNSMEKLLTMPSRERDIPSGLVEKQMRLHQTSKTPPPRSSTENEGFNPGVTQPERTAECDHELTPDLLCDGTGKPLARVWVCEICFTVKR